MHSVSRCLAKCYKMEICGPCGLGKTCIFLGRPMLVGKASSYIHELSFLFYQYTTLSSRAVDGHQIYSGGLVVGQASTVGIEILPTPPLIFMGGQKVQNLVSFLTSLANHSTLSRPHLKMQLDIQISCIAMIALCPRQVC